MKKTLLLIIVIICYLKGNTQQCNAIGAQIRNNTQLIKNIKLDFGALGNGYNDDHDAFKSAANFINSNGGNVQLIIPDGIYIVGHQELNLGTASSNATIYAGDPVMVFSNVSNVSIIGANFSKIIYKDSLKFGTFNTLTGLPPEELDLYNPLNFSVGTNPNFDYKYAGTIGNFLTLINCNNFLIKDLEINGNSDNYLLGGNWGLGERPIELKNSYGIVLKDVYNSTFLNLKIHHFGVDNVLLSSSFVSGDTSFPNSHDIIFNKVFCEYAGRNGFSWVGGKDICVINSSFNHSAVKSVKTKPGYGMDIEPEGILGKTLCVNGFFYNNIFSNNAGLALVAGTSLDNPVYNTGSGYSYNHYFNKCQLVGRYNSSTHNFINRIIFDSCKFFGQVINYGSSIDNTLPAIFQNSYFSDCYNGDRMYDKPLLTVEFGYKMELSNCIFDKYYSSGKNSWLYYFGTSTFPCNEDFYKASIKNCIFNFFEPSDNQLKYLSVGRNVKFSNNTFYKSEGDNLRWYNSLGCEIGIGEGNVDLYNGLQYFSWPSQFNYPICNSQKECEQALYLSDPLDIPQEFIAKDFIYVDAKIELGENGIIFQAPNFIILNPGFDSKVVDEAQIELRIGNCIEGINYPKQKLDCDNILISKKSNN